MLQFSATLYTVTARFAPRTSWRLTALIANNSSTVTGEQAAVSIKEDSNAKFTDVPKDILQKEKQQDLKKLESQIKFDISGKQIVSENNVFGKQFQAARSINDLLNLAMLPDLSVNNALKLISSITNEINSGKSQIVNIETDQRFIHLRKIVKANDQIKNMTSDDLSQYSQLSTPAMISIIALLREQGNRNTPLLRMLSYNIVKYNKRLNLKQCASLLYSMAILSFPDKMLLEKIMSDLLDCIPKSTNATTNKYIITSLGFLRHKNEDVLDAFCETLFVKSINYKYQDYSSILQTFAVLQYKSERARSFIEKFAQEANPFLTSASEWLDIVWSLAVLDAALPQHIESVLEPAFMQKLAVGSDINVAKKLKLLNINAVAQFIVKDYKGPFLNTNTEEFNDLCLLRTKIKKTYIEALSETLQKLYPSLCYFKTDIDTHMGFLLDAEYRIDDEGNPIPLQNWNEQDTSKDVNRIAIMTHDYYDYCRGQNDLIGSIYLYTQLLRARGYKLVRISYENFSIQDKIEKRIEYLKRCVKSVQDKRSI